MPKLKKTTKKKMFENIYDLTKGGEFEQEARQEMDQFLKGKQIIWDGNNGIITIGRDFKIKLL